MTLIKNAWKEINGKWFYFNYNGTPIHGATQEIGNAYYAFNADGTMATTGWVKLQGNTYYVKNDKLAIKADGTDYKTEISSKYIAIGNKVYDTNTLSEVDSNTFIPEKEDALIESLTGLELTECRNGYGLKYKGEEIL